MKAVASTRIVSRLLLALTFSGVLHAWLPTDKPKRKMRMADAAPELNKAVAEALVQVQVEAKPQTL
jgi:hypothetical protein